MSDEQEKLADEIVDRLMERIYREVGKSILEKLFWLAIAVLICLGFFFGLIKLPNGG